MNTDVEKFLKEKAIIFEKNDISRTSLIFAHGSKRDLILVGYYTIAQKPFKITDGVSNKARKEIAGHHFFTKQPIPALLLGQLGKNYSEKSLWRIIDKWERSITLCLQENEKSIYFRWL